VDYPEFSIHYIILAILMITLSLQTKIGEKVSILSERVYELWNGKADKKKAAGKQGSNGVKVSQPISGQQQHYSQQMSSQAPIDRSVMSTSINSLPNSADQHEQMPNYNNMYQNTPTPLIHAASPGIQENVMEPMAANSVLGGNGFGSW
jgi:hypothetical protein